MWKHILYATDFSETAENAFPHALTLAVLSGSRLTLLHGRVPLQDDPNNPRFHFPELEEIYSRAESIAGELLEEKEKKTGDIEVQPTVARGIDADSVILTTARDSEADLIVMGTHGRRGLDQLVLGSVAHSVIQKSPVPVFTVRKDVSSPDPELPYRRILVPVDLSPGSSSSLETAIQIAERCGSKVYVLHVAPYGGSGEAKEKLSQLLSSHPSEGVETILSHGVVEEQILSVARQKSIDLVVMSRKGESLLEYVLLGSTTERMIRTAPCPVLNVPG